MNKNSTNKYIILGASSMLHCKQLGSGWVRQNTTVFYPMHYADDDMFRPLWAIFRSHKFIKRNTVKFLIISRSAILNFQRDLVVVWSIHFELLISPISRVQKIEWM